MLQLPTLLLQDLMYRVKAAIVTVRVARPTDREITTEEITTIVRRVIFPGYYFMRIAGAALQRSNS